MLRDATTGIFTRASFAGRLRQEMNRARLQGQPVSLLLIDLDYFKSVNDAFGHSRGDDVLLEWTSRLRAAIRSNDLPFRYGGDEFVVVLPGAPKAQASALAHRLLAETSARPFGADPPLNLSVSIGAASFPDDADSHDELFRQADLRLMEAKRLGRGRVVDQPAEELDSTSHSGAPSRLVGRDEATQGLLAFLDQLSGRARGLCTVEGVHGSGRSRFLREAEQSARLRGLAVLTVTGASRRTEPFAALRSMLRRLSPGSQAPAAPDDWLRLLQSHASSRVGLLVTVDDAESVDASSLDVIRRLLDSPGTGIYGLILACEPIHVDRLTGTPVYQESLHLPPLGKEALRVWARGLLHWEPPDSLLEWLQQETEGLPGRMVAAIQGLQESGILQKEADAWALTGDLPPVSGGAHSRSAVESANGNLPSLLTSFVGRHHELGVVRQLLTSSRLVTLAGPGGIGKTRLAIEAGSDLAERYPGGVWLTELASLADGSLIMENIASSLGLAGESDGTTEATLIAHLQSRTLLLVLDNCEHLVEAAARVAEKLLLRCPRLSILATSREPLAIAGESVCRVPPLSFPSSAEGDAPEADPAAIDAQFEAVRLFCSRAALTRPAFLLTRENLPAVARICRQLDGIPLALELAAARSNVLPVEQIAERLTDRFRLLRGGSRTALPRQQTLKALIDWSYDLLNPEEQRVLRALSVFAGGCSAEAAEAAATHRGGGDDLFDVLARLVDKSLIQVDLGDQETAEPRYRLLETIRQYAHERLVEAGEAERCREQHARYFGRFAEAAELELMGPRQREWLDRVEGELDNIRAALEWCREEAPDLGVGLAGALVRFWQVRGHVIEGREWLATLFDARQRLNPMVPPGRPYLVGLLAAGQLAHLKHDSQQAIDYLTAADILSEHLGEPRLRVRALCTLGYPQHESGDVSSATVSWQSGLELSRTLSDTWARAFALRSWAFHLNMLGQDERALEALDQSLQLFRDCGDVWMKAHALWRLGYTRLWRRGDFRTAASLLREGRELWASLREWTGVSHILAELGWAVYFEGNLAASRQAFEELLARATDRHDSWGLPTALYHLGKLAQLEGEFEKAESYLRQIFALDASDWLVANHTGWATQTLGLIDVLQGREDRAREWLWEALSVFQKRPDPLGVAVTIQNLARLKVRTQPEVAAALFAWASAAYVRQGWVLCERHHPENPEDLQTLRSTLGEHRLLIARSAGVTLSAEEALAMALEEGRGLPANLTCR